MFHRVDVNCMCLLFCVINIRFSGSLSAENVNQLKILSRFNITIDNIKCIDVDPNDIIYHLYTYPYPKNIKIDNNTDWSRRKRFPVKVIIHGFQSNSKEDWVKNMTKAYLENEDMNVILVDWSNYANMEYLHAICALKKVAANTAKLITNLIITSELPPGSFHLLGHSLGAHIAGIAGFAVQNFGKLGRITGMDPAAPLFTPASKESSLDSSDATFVDIIHTDGGKFGIEEAIGTVDFYPQGGRSPQPACQKDNSTEIFVGCSHAISHDYYIQSIIQPNIFKAKKCDSYEEYLGGFCENCTNAIMGENVNKHLSGKFYLTVDKLS